MGGEGGGGGGEGICRGREWGVLVIEEISGVQVKPKKGSLEK